MHPDKVRPSFFLWERLASLRFVIALAVTLGILISSGLAFIYSASELREQHIESVEANLLRLAKLTALAMREPLWQFDQKNAESIIESVFVDPNVQFVEIVDHKNGVFSSRTRATLEELTAKRLVVTATQPIERDGVPLGQLALTMSTASYIDQLEIASRRAVLVTFLVVIGALAIIQSAMHWSIIRPIRRLVASSEKIAKGRLAEPIDRVPFAELGVLAVSLESTRQSLLSLFAIVEERNQALAESNETLEQRVAERTRSLEEALQQLKRAQDEIIQSEKLASLGRVVAVVAHELNTPIGNALVVATSLPERLNQVMRETEAGTLKKTDFVNALQSSIDGISIFTRNIKRAAQLISNFKQVAVDQTSDQRRIFDLATVTQEVLNMLDPVIKRKGCHVELDLQNDIQCDGFPGAYGQLLSNLVTNVLVHAYPDGASGPIYVSAMVSAPGHATLTVRDEGTGMTPEVRAKIFDPFFTTRLGSGGSGLGMNIVHRIVVRTLGGKITILSEVGSGSTIDVTFPLVSPHRNTSGLAQP